MKLWLSLTELSSESGIARDILREWIVTGKLPSFRVAAPGRKRAIVKIRRQDFEDFMEQFRRRPSPAVEQVLRKLEAALGR